MKKPRVFAELKSMDKVAHTIRAYRGQIESICRRITKAKLQLHQGADSMMVLETFATAFTQKYYILPACNCAGAEGRLSCSNFKTIICYS